MELTPSTPRAHGSSSRSASPGGHSKSPSMGAYTSGKRRESLSPRGGSSPIPTPISPRRESPLASNSHPSSPSSSKKTCDGALKMSFSVSPVGCNVISLDKSASVGAQERTNEDSCAVASSTSCCNAADESGPAAVADPQPDSHTAASPVRLPSQRGSPRMQRRGDRSHPCSKSPHPSPSGKTRSLHSPRTSQMTGSTNNRFSSSQERASRVESSSSLRSHPHSGYHHMLPKEAVRTALTPSKAECQRAVFAGGLQDHGARS
jgi:hypothetical protein